MKRKNKYKVVGYKKTKIRGKELIAFCVERFKTREEAFASKDTFIKNRGVLIYKRTIFGNADLIYWNDALDYERNCYKQKF
jgi:hypothetical protein